MEGFWKASHILCWPYTVSGYDIGVTGTVWRRCIRNDVWEEFFGCFREEIGMLLEQVINAELARY